MEVLITLFLDEEKLKILEDVFRRPVVTKKETLKNKYTFQIREVAQVLVFNMSTVD